MKIIKKLILLSFIFAFTSCGTLKDGFINQKKNNNDEFLVEKKSPLIMPPNYNELPIPNRDIDKVKSDNNSIKDLVTKEDIMENNSKETNYENRDIEESLLDKIKKN